MADYPFYTRYFDERVEITYPNGDIVEVEIISQPQEGVYPVGKRLSFKQAWQIVEKAGDKVKKENFAYHVHLLIAHSFVKNHNMLEAIKLAALWNKQGSAGDN